MRSANRWPAAAPTLLLGPYGRIHEEEVMGYGFRLLDRALCGDSRGMLRPEWTRGL